MFGWWKEHKKQLKNDELRRAKIEDSVLNGAQKPEDVVIGRLPQPRISDGERERIGALDFTTAFEEFSKLINAFRPFAHRNYSEAEATMITEELMRHWWLYEIPQQVLKKFSAEDHEHDDASDNFVEACFNLAYLRGFIPGESDSPPEEQIHWLKRKWASDYQEIVLDRIGTEIFGEELLPLVKLIAKGERY